MLAPSTPLKAASENALTTTKAIIVCTFQSSFNAPLLKLSPNLLSSHSRIIRIITNCKNGLTNSKTFTVTNLYDLEYRNYDPALGRMNQVDPLAGRYSSLTPYQYAFNSPAIFTDQHGDHPDQNGNIPPAPKPLRDPNAWRAWEASKYRYRLPDDDDITLDHGEPVEGNETYWDVMNDFIDSDQDLVDFNETKMNSDSDLEPGLYAVSYIFDYHLVIDIGHKFSFQFDFSAENIDVIIVEEKETKEGDRGPKYFFYEAKDTSPIAIKYFKEHNSGLHFCPFGPVIPHS